MLSKETTRPCSCSHDFVIVADYIVLVFSGDEYVDTLCERDGACLPLLF
jgi:hypothetical protein